MTKVCSKCKVEKCLDEFSQRKEGRYNNICKTCDAERARERRYNLSNRTEEELVKVRSSITHKNVLHVN